MQFQKRSRQHSHHFDQANPLLQKKILYATLLTAAMMVFEIWGGWVFNSMALLADGWHMSSHMLALGLAYVAYKASRYYAHDPRFNFGTWKIEILAAYSSAILLLLVALFMAYQSVIRLFNPVQIHYQEAIPIAVFGLLVNLVCAWLLHSDHHHGHGDQAHHSHSSQHHHHHTQQHDHGAQYGEKHAEQHMQDGQGQHAQDLNHRAAYLHVIADAVTSVLAIIALFAAKYWGWTFLDALLGIVGAILVGKWSIGLIKDSSKTLIDAHMDEPLVEQIRQQVLHLDGAIEITDLHLFKVGYGKFAGILALETSDQQLNADRVHAALAHLSALVHLSIEINPPLQFTAVPRETKPLLGLKIKP
ncbi:cation diffusion facilitator family transporter [Acinetobacter calcoaceticus]|uniref:Cation diffusion facilitator family transporter n=1 Tax=Acinetobacter calcoaceticus TaxID=471 RepID=A0A4R1Y1G5_ACICA|nr:cation diffusion facilitator family transporter [Acinetobacter calcoaceticus]